MPIKLVIIHSADGVLGYYEAEAVPRKGDWIQYENQTYEIKRVIWTVKGLHVRLMVDDLKI